MIESLPVDLRKRIVVYGPTGCWIWTGAVTSAGYGNLYIGGGRSGPRYATAHRFIYELFVGPVPPAFDLDHLCRVRQCCNPMHVEPVTRRENLRRGGVLDALTAASKQRGQRTQCGRGHELNDDNLYIHNGRRHCRACGRLRYHERTLAAGTG